LTRVSSCSYVSPGAMEKSKLRSSGARNVFGFFIIVLIGNVFGFFVSLAK